MRSCCTDEELASSVVTGLPSESLKDEANLEDLTLSELLSVLLNPSNYGSFFRFGFGPRRDYVSLTLEPVRDIRNKIVHFRDEVAEDEMQTLAEVVAWLRRKMLTRGVAR
ncbi:hypothetical protein GCM10010404_27720 [Nonomuraea africana]